MAGHLSVAVLLGAVLFAAAAYQYDADDQARDRATARAAADAAAAKAAAAANQELRQDGAPPDAAPRKTGFGAIDRSGRFEDRDKGPMKMRIKRYVTALLDAPRGQLHKVAIMHCDAEYVRNLMQLPRSDPRWAEIRRRTRPVRTILRPLGDKWLEDWLAGRAAPAFDTRHTPYLGQHKAGPSVSVMGAPNKGIPAPGAKFSRPPER